MDILIKTPMLGNQDGWENTASPIDQSFGEKLVFPTTNQLNRCGLVVLFNYKCTAFVQFDQRPGPADN